MHKLIEYICDELDELERKAEKDKSLSMAEMQYVDLLAHAKKNLLKAEEMSDGEGYSNMYRYPMYGDGDMRSGNYTYARGGRRGGNTRRDAMGRYSRDGGYSMGTEEMVKELHELMADAPDDRTRKEFERFIEKIERM